MFLAQKKQIEQEMKALEKALHMIQYKCWYYDETLKDGTEERMKHITPEQMPEEIRHYYEQAHQ